MEPFIEIAEVVAQMVGYYVAFEFAIEGFSGWNKYPTRKRRMYLYLSTLILATMRLVVC